MIASLRTALQWLQSHGLSDTAECWVLGSDTVQPVTGVTPNRRGDMILWTVPPWADPAPVPMQYAEVCDTLLGSYSGGGTLLWAANPDDTYRGSYVVNPAAAVFFVFLPDEVQIVESHIEKMEQRKQQAIQLSQAIQENETWVISQPPA